MSNTTGTEPAIEFESWAHKILVMKPIVILKCDMSQLVNTGSIKRFLTFVSGKNSINNNRNYVKIYQPVLLQTYGYSLLEKGNTFVHISIREKSVSLHSSLCCCCSTSLCSLCCTFVFECLWTENKQRAMCPGNISKMFQRYLGYHNFIAQQWKTWITFIIFLSYFKGDIIALYILTWCIFNNLNLYLNLWHMLLQYSALYYHVLRL